MGGLSLDEDLHVHSRFSDGEGTPAENAAAAVALGLRRLGCVDHVRHDSIYVPEFVAAIRALRATAPIELTIGVEARMLDARGSLDLPPAIEGVELVFAAVHQIPSDDGPVSPESVRDRIAGEPGAAGRLVEQIVGATIAAMHRAADEPYDLVLAHLFAVLPRIGVDEAAVSSDAIDRIARAASETRTIIECSERWRCPGARMIAAAVRYGVRVVASTDSHTPRGIGRYSYVAGIAAALETAGVRERK